MTTISVDAMGGDEGPGVVIGGASLALTRHPDLSFVFFGDEAIVAPLIDADPRLKERARLIHTDVAVSMDAKPSQALRTGRYKSSMWKALEAVKTGEADVAVSAGNTGALMAMSKFCLRTFPGVQRPAIAAIWPTRRGESVVLDVGANVGAEAGQLVEFAILGGAMAKALFGLERPTVGLLNIGIEEVKGLEAVREAGQALREANHPEIDYRGFVEGTDIGKGTVDVVVTEGFSGNIALKTAEGTARQIGDYLRAVMSASLRAKLGYVFAAPAFAALKRKMDPRRSNGGVFLGLNGTVIKSHGGTDPIGFAAALDLAYDMARNNLQGKVAEGVAALERLRPAVSQAEAVE